MIEYSVGFPFCGLGAGALGFLQAEARLFGHQARFRSVGGIDNDAMACRDFETLTGSPALCADMKKLTVEELRAFMGDRAPDVIFSSPPCKGFSSLLSPKQAKQAKYRALNRLVLDWVTLMLTAWPVPPKLFLLENVPRIAGPRGKRFLGAVKARLRRAGYVFHEGTHDAGELGGLAQRRQRFLLVARHPQGCPPLLYQPPKKRVRGCGEVLDKLPLPGEGQGGPMHELPKLSWLNWVRLALIPAGGDWRDLDEVLLGRPRRTVFRRHAVGRWKDPVATVAGSGSNGPCAVADPRPKRGANNGVLGVLDWEEPTGTVTGNGRPASGKFAVADPRPFGHVDRVSSWDAPIGTVTHSPAPSSGGGAVADPRLRPQAGNAGLHEGKYRVRGWKQPAGAVIGATRIGSGAPSVADERARDWYANVLRIVPWDEASGTVTGAGRPSSGAVSVADPRVRAAFDHGWAVLRWDEASSTVAGGSHPGQGAYSVADIRLGCEPRSGAYGVIDWSEAAKTITGSADVDNGPFAVCDPRAGQVIGIVRDRKKAPPFLPRIIAADGTWHRPLTTLELAALQALPTTMADGSPLVLATRDGKPNHSAWRERIGNAVPVTAAQAIAEQMLVCLLHGGLEAFALSSGGDVWVKPDERESIEAT